MKVEQCKIEVLEHINKCGKELEFILAEITLLFSNYTNSTLPNACSNATDREIKQMCIKEGIRELREELSLTEILINKSIEENRNEIQEER